MASAGTTPFYGREHELQRLLELAGKKTASLVIIKGRRRIGKSRLATELARRLPGYGALKFQGLPPTAHLTAGQEREGCRISTAYWACSSRTSCSRTGWPYSSDCKSTPTTFCTTTRFFQRKTLRHAGCQIDYLIQIRQNTLYVCEIKFSKNVLPLAVISDVQEKIARLSMPRHMSYRPVLIHAGAIAEGIAEQEYFASMIDFGELIISADTAT